MMSSLASGAVRARWWLAAFAVGAWSLVVLPGWRDPLVVGLAVAGAATAPAPGSAAARRGRQPRTGRCVAGRVPGVVPGRFAAVAGSDRCLDGVGRDGDRRAREPARRSQAADGLANAIAAMVTFLVVPLVVGWWVRERRRDLAGLREQTERLARERDAVVARERAEERARVVVPSLHDNSSTPADALRICPATIVLLVAGAVVGLGVSGSRVFRRARCGLARAPD
jgi:hypothetical protein